MNRGTISRRYATALYMYASKHRKEERVYVAVGILSEIFLQHQALRRVLASRTLPAPQKEQLIVLAAGGNVDECFLRFIRLLIQQKREDFLQMICLSYQEIYRRKHKLLHVDIVTSAPVDETIIASIATKIEQLTQETVDVTVKVDPLIIGGYILRWDTFRWDASIASQLRMLNKTLKDTVKIE